MCGRMRMARPAPPVYAAPHAIAARTVMLPQAAQLRSTRTADRPAGRTRYVRLPCGNPPPAAAPAVQSPGRRSFASLAGTHTARETSVWCSPGPLRSHVAKQDDCSGNAAAPGPYRSANSLLPAVRGLHTLSRRASSSSSPRTPSAVHISMAGCRQAPASRTVLLSPSQPLPTLLPTTPQPRRLWRSHPRSSA
jgi:hypothetical protein